MVFNNNNFITHQTQTILQIDDANSVNALDNYWGTTLASKVDDGEITQGESDQIFGMLEYSVEDKKEPEIISMVDDKISEMKG